ncbi:MAG: 1-deoxy-D-xylulose-5-phosphate reductoisomerase, partial [Pseudomonadota bacterium]
GNAPPRATASRASRNAGNRSGAFPALLNAANEVAVAHFLDRRLAFRDIANTTAHVLEAAARENWPAHLDTLDEVMCADETGRRLAEEFCKTRAA